MVDPVAAAGKVLAVAVSKSAPSVIGWLRVRLQGKELLIVGPPNSGKSSICEYLIYGELRRPERNRQSTLEVEKHKPVSLEVGDQKRLDFRLKRTLDVPGQYLPRGMELSDLQNDADRLRAYGRAHAEMFLDRSPDVLLIVLDIAQVAKGQLSWLEGFSEKLFEDEERALAAIDALSCLHFALNKYDLIAKADFEKAREKVSDVMVAAKPELKEKIERLPILPSNGMQTEYGKEYINYLIYEVARIVEKS